MEHQKDAHDGASPWIAAMAWGTARWDALEQSSILQSIAQPSITSRATPPPAFYGQAPYAEHSPANAESVTANTWPMEAWELIGGASRWTQPSAPTPLPERQSPVACSSAASPNIATLNLAPWYLAAIACGNSPERQGLSPKPHHC